MSQIEVKNLTYIYSAGTSSEKKALNNVNLSIEKGEFIGLIGQTGSGKSTFVRQLNALLKTTKGQVFLNGRDIWQNPKNVRDIRFKVGLVFQYPEHQLFEDTVYKDIAFGPKNMSLSEKDIEKKVYSACEFVGLDFALLKKSPFDLSGGEKRKAAIAGVIAMEPEVLILDEPTAGLDPKSRVHLLARLKEYNKLREKTVILISHSMEDIAEYADRAIVLDNGNLVMFDSVKKVFSNKEMLKKIGLKPPQITAIMSEFKDIIPNLSDGILTVDEAVKILLNFIKNRRECIGE